MGGKVARKSIRAVPVVAAFLGICGCAAFNAGYREPFVRNVTMGMPSAGVSNVAGAPQRRDTVTTAAGPLEVWYYVVPACRGGFEERPIAFADDRVVAIGREALEALRAFFAAYSTGYQTGLTDRDLAWKQAIASTAPEIAREVAKAQSRAYAAGEQAGASKTKEAFRRAWEEYVQMLQTEQSRRFAF